METRAAFGESLAAADNIEKLELRMTTKWYAAVVLVVGAIEAFDVPIG